jgi:hypothetical protein
MDVLLADVCQYQAVANGGVPLRVSVLGPQVFVEAVGFGGVGGGVPPPPPPGGSDIVLTWLNAEIIDSANNNTVQNIYLIFIRDAIFS